MYHTASLVLSQAAPFLSTFDSAAVAFAKLEADMDHVSSIDGTSEHTGHVLLEVVGDIELRNVSFTFPSIPDKPVLQDLSFLCPAGRKIHCGRPYHTILQLRRGCCASGWRRRQRVERAVSSG